MSPAKHSSAGVTDGRTDRQTDRRTDGRTDRQTEDRRTEDGQSDPYVSLCFAACDTKMTKLTKVLKGHTCCLQWLDRKV